MVIQVDLLSLKEYSVPSKKTIEEYLKSEIHYLKDRMKGMA